jgi:hypothetical protein
VGDTEPTGQVYPAAQGPEHRADGSAELAPYTPAGHAVQAAAPIKLYDPAAQATAVGDIEPTGQIYPAAQGPEQSALVKPGTLPNAPAEHKPVHEEEVSPALLPYLPDGHGVHTPAPARLYVPGLHCNVVPLVDPAGQAYPAMHAPEHVEAVRPEKEPKRPGSHGPEHDGDVAAGLLPYVPAGHMLQAKAPSKLYLPVGHCDAVGLLDPATQAYPALQGPEQLGETCPAVAP